MPDTYDRIKEGLEEALSTAKGEQPAASITVNGHTYVPKADYDELKHLYDVFMAQNKVSSDKADERIAELQSEIADYSRICQRHGIAPSSAELIAAAKEVENEQIP